MSKPIESDVKVPNKVTDTTIHIGLAVEEKFIFSSQHPELNVLLGIVM